MWSRGSGGGRGDGFLDANFFLLERKEYRIV